MREIFTRRLRNVSASITARAKRYLVFSIYKLFLIMRNKLELLTLYNRRRFLRFIYIFKAINKQNCPKQLKGCFINRNELHGRSLRDNGNINVPQAKTLSGRRTFMHAGASDWNSLLTDLRKCTKLCSFKPRLFTSTHRYIKISADLEFHEMTRQGGLLGVL